MDSKKDEQAKGMSSLQELSLEYKEKVGGFSMKGQGVIDYLLTYGWALLIIVVVGSALYVLGVFSPPSNVNLFCNNVEENLSYDNETITCYMQYDRCECDVEVYDERGFL